MGFGNRLYGFHAATRQHDGRFRGEVGARLLGECFSHPNHPKPVNYKGGIHAFSRDLLDGKFRKFPERVLRPIKGMTLGLLVDKLDADRMPDR